MAVAARQQHTTLQLQAVLSRQAELISSNTSSITALDLSTSVAFYLLSSRTFFNSFWQQSGKLLKSHCVIAMATRGTSAS